MDDYVHLYHKDIRLIPAVVDGYCIWISNIIMAGLTIMICGPARFMSIFGLMTLGTGEHGGYCSITVRMF